MKMYVLFGLPGAGKSYIGKVLQTHFGFYVYEADDDMSQEMKDAIVQETVTDQMRDVFFNKLIVKVSDLKNQYEHIVVSQTFIKEKYRRQFLEAFPDVKFIFIDVDSAIREKRLMSRNGFMLKLDQWRKMATLFETAQIEHVRIQNNDEGDEGIKRQIAFLFN